MSQSDSAGSVKLEKFLTPEAMLTPGIAGSTVMAITNVLAPTFAWPQAWIALGLSFTVGLLLLRAEQGLLPKVVFYVLNSLVVFTVAFGTNSTGLAVNRTQVTAFSIIGPAIAQDAATDLVALQTQINDLSTQFDSLTVRIGAARQANAPAAEIDALIAEQKTIDDQRTALLGKLVDSAMQAQQIQAPAGSFFSQWKF